jgi:nitrite reductase/ring-hydroxylating ferredoxin subunit
MRALGLIAGFLFTALGAPLLVFLFGPVLRGKAAWPLLGEAVAPTPRPRVPWVRVAPVASLSDAPALITVTAPVQDGWIEGEAPIGVYVRRTADGLAQVFDIHCTHMGCPVQWNAAAGRFFCPCHGGVFDEAGRAVSGPPPRALDQYATKIDAGVVYMGALRGPGA